MLNWLRRWLGPAPVEASEALTAQVDHLRELLEQERAEKGRLLAEERERNDTRERFLRRLVDSQSARIEALINDLVAIADARARAELDRSRWAERALATATGLEGAGPDAIDRQAGMPSPPPAPNAGDAQPVWSHSLVADGHMDPPENDGEAERAAQDREAKRLANTARR